MQVTINQTLILTLATFLFWQWTIPLINGKLVIFGVESSLFPISQKHLPNEWALVVVSHFRGWWVNSIEIHVYLSRSKPLSSSMFSRYASRWASGLTYWRDATKEMKMPFLPLSVCSIQQDILNILVSRQVTCFALLVHRTG